MSGTVLLCAPSVRSDGQQEIYEAWCESLGSRHFCVEALGRADYSVDPWTPLSYLLARADGVAVLGLRQLEISRGLWRGATLEAGQMATVWSSPWMQIEAGMAIASKKPVIIAPERGVREGVFAPENWISNVFGAPAEDPTTVDVERWADAVRRSRIQKAG